MTDLLIRNVRPLGSAPTDILISNGRIAKCAAQIETAQAQVEDAKGAIMVPGLVEAHTHLDKTFMGMGWYPNTVGSDLQSMIDNERSERRRLNHDPHQQSMRHALALVGNGITHIRSHVDVDTENGLAAIEGVLKTKDALKDVVDIEIVAFPQSGLMVRPGTAELLDQAMAMGADLVGGLDPCGIDSDPKGHLDTIFGLAEKHGTGIDIHLHEGGTLGAFSMEMILERTRVLGMKGQISISHAFCLGMPDWNRTEALLEALADQDVAILTTGSPSSDVPAVKRVLGAGIRLGAGCDGVIDTWNPWNRADMLDRARIVAQKNNMRSDADLALALSICSSGGAQVMGVKGHGVDLGNNADFALLSGTTLAEAIATGGPVKLTVKAGKITGRDGKAIQEAS
ncbi:amidohydrolase family protein [Rhodobacteraceae bacterium D3-12]|nr:amidohydrolase family protein [Rhodobacteraceae bacterium D3-12]